MIERLAILTFGRRPVSLTGPARAIDGDTIVVDGEQIARHRCA
jgi:hypothetical protein